MTSSNSKPVERLFSGQHPHWHDGPSWPGVAVHSTTRLWGCSLPPYDQGNVALHVGDNPDHVLRNREILTRALPAEPLWLEQVHGTQILDADQPQSLQGAQADGAFTRQCQRVLAVMTADCLPVVLAEPSGAGVMVLHAGWRGLADGILSLGVERLSQVLGVAAGSLEAWVGPGIGANAYQVGNDVREAFGDEGRAHFTPDPTNPEKWRFHLAGQAEQVLLQAGVAKVHQSRCCTFNDTRWFSYRRDGHTGRFVTLAWLKGDGTAVPA